MVVKCDEIRSWKSSIFLFNSIIRSLVNPLIYGIYHLKAWEVKGKYILSGQLLRLSSFGKQLLFHKRRQIFWCKRRWRRKTAEAVLWIESRNSATTTCFLLVSSRKALSCGKSIGKRRNPFRREKMGLFFSDRFYFHEPILPAANQSVSRRKGGKSG